MSKIHTRAKRRMGKRRGRNRKKRPKTFPTEEKANRYAEEHHILNYELEDISSKVNRKKIKIVEK